MKRQILLLAFIAAAFSSCTTAYRTGQTPDDVYYSPTRPQDEYVREEEKNEQYKSDDEYYDDRYLKMKVQNRTRWDYFDDWYAYDRYSYRYDMYFGTYSGFYGSYWNPYNSWNYYYNPYFTNYYYPYYPGSVVVITPGKVYPVVNNTVVPRNFNLNSYTNNQYSNRNNDYKVNYKSGGSSRPVYNNSNSGLSNTIKQIFSGSNNNYNSGSPSRSYSPSSSGGNTGGGTGSSSSGSSSGGGVSRPSRGGN
jgi:uncharacterized membrane protein YgcG